MAENPKMKSKMQPKPHNEFQAQEIRQTGSKKQHP